MRYLYSSMLTQNITHTTSSIMIQYRVYLCFNRHDIIHTNKLNLSKHLIYCLYKNIKIYSPKGRKCSNFIEFSWIFEYINVLQSGIQKYGTTMRRRAYFIIIRKYHINLTLLQCFLPYFYVKALFGICVISAFIYIYILFKKKLVHC